jgi:hypothetical protein
MSRDPYRRGVTSGDGSAGLENCVAICDALHNQVAIAQNSAGTYRIVSVCRRNIFGAGPRSNYNAFTSFLLAHLF